jgi:thymidylate synthase (FAD)
MEQPQYTDPHFTVTVLEKTDRPQRLIYGAMHQDYSESCIGPAWSFNTMSESKAGEIIAKRLLAHQHFGPLEHPHITFSTGFFPHSVMQQARTHRVATSFDVQSSRYTSKRILDLADYILSVEATYGSAYSTLDTAIACQKEIEKVVYLRPPGFYTDRQGDRYEYTQEQRNSDLNIVRGCVLHYRHNVIDNGFSEEHARGLIPFDIRQHFVVTFNVRSLMHFMDMRMPLDAQYEIRCLCDLMYPHFESWVPDIAAWYSKTRKGKNKLAP